MHEWALAESVIRTAADHAGRSGLRSVSEVSVLLGELQAVDREIFVFALRELAKTSPGGMRSCKFRILKEPASFKCRVCAEKFTLKALKRTEAEAENIHFIPEMARVFLKCPGCKSPDFDIVAGRGVSIKDIRGEK
ncbi:MAG TPA: hydrogenase nickel incorporation protein HypA [Elusimicrobiales bacterium]|nr:hydrogenase nickel incorporation protein HypA [Elusimicrobiales bacterium]